MICEEILVCSASEARDPYVILHVSAAIYHILIIDLSQIFMHVIK
jgi:hypothetical protein